MSRSNDKYALNLTMLSLSPTCWNYMFLQTWLTLRDVRTRLNVQTRLMTRPCIFGSVYDPVGKALCGRDLADDLHDWCDVDPVWLCMLNCSHCMTKVCRVSQCPCGVTVSLGGLNEMVVQLQQGN